MAEQIVAAQIVPGTVAELRDAVRGLLKDEDERANSLNTRASALTGFVGVILSVAAAAGVAIGTGSGPQLSGWGKATVGPLMGIALISLVAAVVLAVAKVLFPREGISIATEDTDRYILPEFTGLKPGMVSGYLADAYAQALKIERVKNKTKATWLGRAYLMVCAGLVAVALAGALATLDRYVGDGEREPERAESRQ